MRKLMFLLCVLTIGLTVSAFTPAAIVKQDKATIICSGGTGHDTWAVIEKADGSFWAIPSMNQQEAGNLPKEISMSMAGLMCKLATK